LAAARHRARPPAPPDGPQGAVPPSSATPRAPPPPPVTRHPHRPLRAESIQAILAAPGSALRYRPHGAAAAFVPGPHDRMAGEPSGDELTLQAVDGGTLLSLVVTSPAHC